MAFLPALFIVSQVSVEPAASNGAASLTGVADLKIRAERAQGAKCERCWNYSVHVGESKDYPALCERCVAAVDEIERDGGVTSHRSAKP